MATLLMVMHKVQRTSAGPYTMASEADQSQTVKRVSLSLDKRTFAPLTPSGPVIQC